MADEKKKDNSLKDYLIKIGFVVDKKSLANVKSSFKSFEADLKKLAGSAKKAYESTRKIFDFDNDMTRKARELMTSRENAYAFTEALDVMGKNVRNLGDILDMTDNEFKEFIELQNAYKSVGVPEDYAQTLQRGRDLLVDINKLRVMVQAGLRRVAYIVIKQLDEPIKRLRGYIADIQKRLPDLLDKASRLVVNIAHHVGLIVDGVMNLVSFFNEKLPSSVKRLVGVFAVVGAGILSGAFGKFMLLLSAIFLLIEDFMVWKAGGKSFFGDNWGIFSGDKSLGSLLGLSDESIEWWNSVFDNLKTSILEIVQAINDFKNTEFGKFITELLRLSIEPLNLALQLTVDLLQTIVEIFSGKAFRDAREFFNQNGILRSEADRISSNASTGVMMDDINAYINAVTANPAMAGQNVPWVNLDVNVKVDKNGNVITGISNDGQAVLQATNNASYSTGRGGGR